jgi:hypothetical protein
MFMSVKTFRSKLQHDVHGYVATLIGTEEPLLDLYIPEGDEVPGHCIEVAYLPSVFPRQGSAGCALGFRSGNSLIEWICFSQPVDSILSSWTGDHTWPNEVFVKSSVHRDDPCRLFDLVAFMPKGLERRRVKGSNPEHKKWHDSLWGAKLRPLSVKLGWKSFGNELRAHYEGLQARYGWENGTTNDKLDEGEDNDELTSNQDDADNNEDDEEGTSHGNVVGNLMHIQQDAHSF